MYPRGVPSWPARIASAFIRVVIRRRDWGEERRLARRARRLFGTPKVYADWVARDLTVTPAQGEVRGEWLSVNDPAPGVIVYVHGGGYVSCSSQTHRPLTAALARLSRRRVFSVDYRRAPEHPFPAAFDDVCAAYRWLLDSGHEPSTLALAGESAGGGLILALGLHAKSAGWPGPACMVAMSPWTDLQATGQSLESNDGRCAMFRTPNCAAFASVYLAGARADDVRASPLYGPWQDMSPTLLQVGSTELLLDDARRVHDRIQAAGGASWLTVYDDVPHGWQLLTPFVPEARAAVREAVEFIEANTAN